MFKGLEKMVPTNSKAARRLHLLRFLLIALCSVFGFGVAINVYSSAINTFAVATNSALGSSPQVTRFVLVQACGTALDVVTFICFMLFTLSIVRNRAFFGVMQTRLLLAVGTTLLLHVVVGLLYPPFDPGAAGGGLVDSSPVTPTLDLRMLSFSLMFFALAGIFEYGRILQQDSDDIL